MATPVIEQITQQILTTLVTITIANGYNQNITVERSKSRGNQPGNNKCVLHEMDPDPIVNEVLMLEGWMQPYELDCFIEISEDQNDTVFPSALLNNLSADIYKALTVDITRNNLAIDTMNFGYSDFEASDGSGLHMRKVTFSVHYRHKYKDPYIVG